MLSRRVLNVTHARQAQRVRAECLLIVAGSAFATLGGCMVGPNYQPPEAAVNEAWLNDTASVASTQAVTTRWWETFNDPTLTTLVQSAYSQNLTLRQAGLRVLEARAARGIAVGRMFPQYQEAVGGIGGNQLSENTPSGTGDRSFWSASMGLEAAWELDFWGKFRRGIEASDAEVLQSVADYDAVMVGLAADVATAYILIRSLQERLEYARQNVALQTETLALTQTRFRLGAVSELDVATARSTLANTKALIPEFENALRQSTLVLCVLLGRTPSALEAELRPAAGGAPRLPEAPPIIASGIPADLLRRRPDVRAAERAAAAQSARIGQAVSDLYPRIAIEGLTGFSTTTAKLGVSRSSLADIFNAESFAGFIGLQVNWPIFNYGRIQGNIRVQDARYEQAVTAYQESVLRAAGDVEGGLSEFLRARERAEHLAEAVNASQRATDLSLIQYRAGAVDFIRVNNAQADLVEQQDRLVSARAANGLGAVRAFRALGGGWEVRGQAEFVDPATIERMRARTDWGDITNPAWSAGRDLGFSRPATDAPPPATAPDTPPPPTTPPAGETGGTN